MRNEITTARQQWRCPSWCTVPADVHDADSQPLDHGAGGAIHYSQTWGGSQDEHTRVRLVLSTYADQPDQLQVEIGDRDITPEQAKALALDLLSAVTISGLR